MAHIALTTSFTASKDGAYVTSTNAAAPTMAGVNMSDSTVTVGTSRVALPVGSVTANGGLCMIRNLSSTATVFVGLTDTVTGASNAYFIVGKSEAAVFRRSDISLSLIATAASTRVQVTTVND